MERTGQRQYLGPLFLDPPLERTKIKGRKYRVARVFSESAEFPKNCLFNP